MLPQLNTGKMSWCGGLSCATVLARDWSRVARCLQPAFRRQQSNSTFIARRTAANRRAKLPPILLLWLRPPVDERSEASKDVWNRCFFIPSVLQAASPLWLLDPQLVAAATAAGLDKRRKNEAITRRRSDFQSCGCARRCQASHCCTWDCCCSHAADATRYAGRCRGSRC